jgi:hypothetical protein
VTSKDADLVQQARDLVESIEQLREALLDYKTGCQTLLDAGERGRTPGSTMERVALLKFSEKRERVNEAMRAFESTRRHARVALIAVAQEEGSTLTSVARTLGLSRQLTSRLVSEAKDAAR